MLETNISLSQIVSKKIYINPTEKTDFPLGLLQHRVFFFSKFNGESPHISLCYIENSFIEAVIHI